MTYKEIYRIRILLFGIMLTGFAIYQLPTIWTFKSSLFPLHGTVKYADTYVTTVNDGRGHKSQKSELVFYLNEYNKKFCLVENIGNSFTNEEYQSILKGLRKADSVTVWVKKSDHQEFQPKVFQIDRDGKLTLLEFERVRTADSPLTAFMLVLGLGSIGFYFWTKYPEKFKKLFA